MAKATVHVTNLLIRSSLWFSVLVKDIKLGEPGGQAGNLKSDFHAAALASYAALSLHTVQHTCDARLFATHRDRDTHTAQYARDCKRGREAIQLKPTLD